MFRPVAIISCCTKVECPIHFTFNGSSKLFFLLVALLRPQKKKKKKNLSLIKKRWGGGVRFFFDLNYWKKEKKKLFTKFKDEKRLNKNLNFLKLMDEYQTYSKV